MYWGQFGCHSRSSGAAKHAGLNISSTAPALCSGRQNTPSPLHMNSFYLAILPMATWVATWIAIGRYLELRRYGQKPHSVNDFGLCLWVFCELRNHFAFRLPELPSYPDLTFLKLVKAMSCGPECLPFIAWESACPVSCQLLLPWSCSHRRFLYLCQALNGKWGHSQHPIV